MELGYWKLRGLSNGIRILLDYCEADWTNTEYEVVEGTKPGEQTIKVGARETSWDASAWFNVKMTEEHQVNNKAGKIWI